MSLLLASFSNTKKNPYRNICPPINHSQNKRWEEMSGVKKLFTYLITRLPSKRHRKTGWWGRAASGEVWAEHESKASVWPSHKNKTEISRADELFHLCSGCELKSNKKRGDDEHKTHFKPAIYGFLLFCFAVWTLFHPFTPCSCHCLMWGVFLWLFNIFTYFLTYMFSLCTWKMKVAVDC